MPAPLDPRHAVYAGSFDPITLGHMDIVHRGARIFERLTVAIGINPDKQPLFSADERMAMMLAEVRELPNVTVDCFAGLTVDFVRKCGAAVMLRGIRTVSDIESEFIMALTNYTLASNIETVFLMSSERYSHVSSTLIKQIAHLGRESSADQLQKFVPQSVVSRLMAKYREK